MLISRAFKETISDVPKRIGDSIAFTRIEKLEISKTSLLEQKKRAEEALAMYQAQLDEINQLLDMLKE